MDEPRPEDIRLFTVGHSSHTTEAFMELLRQNEIDVVADVRSYPIAKYHKQFDTDVISASLKKAGFKYVFLGSEIGGMPRDKSLYDEDGHVVYERIASTNVFRNGIQRILNGIKTYRIAMMCAEENPIGCHRRRLIARALADVDVPVLHIRGNGELHDETVLSDDGGPNVEQLKLF